MKKMTLADDGLSPAAICSRSRTFAARYCAQLRADLGLDQAFPVQFARFVGQAVQGEFGLSLRQGRKVIWDNLTSEGTNLVRQTFPDILVKKRLEDESDEGEQGYGEGSYYAHGN